MAAALRRYRAREQEAFLRAAQPYVKSGRLTGIRLSTRPDCISRENLAMLASYGVTSIELGVQSTDETVLLKSRRGHTAGEHSARGGADSRYDFELGLQMMLGLPGDTRTKVCDGGGYCLHWTPDTARIYPTLVIRDSRLCDLYEAGRYTPLTLTEAVEQSAQIYTMFTQYGIRVLRMGLMASEDMCQGRAIVAGPFHPAFGELVHARLFLDKIRAALRGFSGTKAVLRVNPKDMSKAAGNRKRNIETIKNEQGVKITLIGDESVEPGEILC